MFFNAEKEDQNECFYQIDGYLLHEVGIDFDYNYNTMSRAFIGY